MECHGIGGNDFVVSDYEKEVFRIVDFHTRIIDQFKLTKKVRDDSEKGLNDFAAQLPTKGEAQRLKYVQDPHGLATELFKPDHLKSLKYRVQNVLRALSVAMVVFHSGWLEMDPMANEEEIFSKIYGDTPPTTLSEEAQRKLFHCFCVLVNLGFPSKTKRGQPNKGLYIATCSFLAGTSSSFEMGGREGKEAEFLSNIFEVYFDIPMAKRKADDISEPSEEGPNLESTGKKSKR